VQRRYRKRISLLVLIYIEAIQPHAQNALRLLHSIVCDWPTGGVFSSHAGGRSRYIQVGLF
jgi:hypothetical protein